MAHYGYTIFHKSMLIIKMLFFSDKMHPNKLKSKFGCSHLPIIESTDLTVKGVKRNVAFSTMKQK